MFGGGVFSGHGVYCQYILLQVKIHKRTAPCVVCRKPIRGALYRRADVSKHYANTLIGNVGDGNFRPSFYKSNISAMDRLVVAKFHTNIANRWLFMIERKIMAIILYS